MFFTLTPEQYPSIEGIESVNLKKVDTFFKKNAAPDKDPEHPYQIVLLGTESVLRFADRADRDQAMQDLINATNNMNNTVTSDMAFLNL